MQDTYVIAIDWGSSNMRAWLLRTSGEEIDFFSSAEGIIHVEKNNYIRILTQLIERWASYINSQLVDIFMVGMIGSENGMSFIPYMKCPQLLSAIKPSRPIMENGVFRLWIVPGVSLQHSDIKNVMRGEETQLIGAHKMFNASHYLMPGTHSKWVRVKDNEITDFRTAMTGELFNILLKYSLIGRGLPKQINDSVIFSEGLKVGCKSNNIVNTLFEVRANYVLNALDKHVVSDYLSGVLIGNEVKNFQREFNSDNQSDVIVVAESFLLEKYGLALNHLGIGYQHITGNEAYKTGIKSIIHETRK